MFYAGVLIHLPKKRLRELDRRIRYLQKRIPDLTVADKRADSDVTYFGAEVDLEAMDKQMTIRIVGSDESTLPDAISVLIRRGRVLY